MEREPVLEFQKDHSNTECDTAEKVLCSSSKVSFVFRPVAAKLVTNVEQAQRVNGVEFDKDPSKRRRDREEKILCSSSEVAFVINRSQPN